MKKKMLPLAVSAAAAVTMSAAHAQMFLNDGGLGEMLVLPFYSAENGNATNVAIANTTDRGKAVKVRIIEGQNSQEVLDFNLYMSPYDHFSFAVVLTAEGGGSLVTNDTSCTVPQIAAGEAVPFRNTLYLTDKSAGAADGTGAYDNTGIERTAVGYVEIIEMGQLDDAETYGDDGDAISPMLAAITHGADGVPADCTLPVAAWSTAADGTDGAWLAESKASATDGGLKAGVGNSYMDPTWDGGGLYAYAGVVNAANADAFGQDADAIVDAVELGNTGYVLHYPPGDTRPDFQDPALDDDSIVVVNGKQTTYDLESELQAVSSLFQTTKLANDYVTDPAILGQTDWIITQPTKVFHITPDPALEPYTERWDGQKACEYAAMKAWDREEQEITPPDLSGDPDFSPAPPVDDVETYDLPLCYEVTVVQFGSESAVKTDSLAVDGSPYLPGVDGWARMSLDKGSLTADSQEVTTAARLIGNLEGLPITGFAVQNYGNDSLNDAGSVANYAMSNEHKTNTRASVSTSED